jgi:hypothetical protein
MDREDGIIKGALRRSKESLLFAFHEEIVKEFIDEAVSVS